MSIHTKLEMTGWAFIKRFQRADYKVVVYHLASVIMKGFTLMAVGWVSAHQLKKSNFEQ